MLGRTFPKKQFLTKVAIPISLGVCQINLWVWEVVGRDIIGRGDNMTGQGLSQVEYVSPKFT